MSKVAIQGAATGTGVFTLASPATNTDRTLTLPDEAGTVDTLQRAGNVLQVVHGSGASTTYINSTTYTDIGLSVSITPSSTSSKVAVFVATSMQTDDSDAQQAEARLLRDATELMMAKVAVDIAGGPQNGAYALQWLDSPSSTSALTYKVQGKTSNSVSDFRPQASASIMAMEIAG